MNDYHVRISKKLSYYLRHGLEKHNIPHDSEGFVNLYSLLEVDENAYVRKATAWSLGNYSDAPVLEPLIFSLQNDVAAVRLWASGSLAEAGGISSEKAEKAANLSMHKIRNRKITGFRRLKPEFTGFL